MVTYGADGSHIWADGRLYEIPAVPPRHIADPTGVGDAYRAGLIKGLALGLPWDLAGRMGSLAATYALENPGGQGHFYTPADFVRRFRDHFDDEGRLDSLLAE